jgi:mRNA-degrading endonuclease RelE of RelBE toxin-antitoxin system
MDHIKKLFKKISKKERKSLVSLVSLLSTNKGRKSLKASKLQGSDLYKLRKGRYRIIFHLDKNKKAVIDSIKLRNEKTYKKLK